MPDLFTRLHTAAKAPTLGCGLTLGAVAGHFGTLEAVTIAMVTAAFIVLTSPVAAHMIARAAYLVGVPLWEDTVIDELRDHRPRRAKGGPASQGPDDSGD
jgi:multicomponent Na+:H+ antiporter subunit G